MGRVASIKKDEETITNVIIAPGMVKNLFNKLNKTKPVYSPYVITYQPKQLRRLHLQNKCNQKGWKEICEVN